MKKFINPIPLGGMPLSTNRITSELNVEIWNAMDALLKGIQDKISGGAAAGPYGIIVSGCEITGAGPYGMNPGIIYLNGELLRYDGFTIAGPLLDATTPYSLYKYTDVITQKQFADGSLKNLLTEPRAAVGGGVSGSAHYVGLFTPNSVASLDAFRLPQRLLDAGIQAAINAILDSAAAYSTTGFTYGSGFASGSSTFGFKKTPGGKVTLRGSISKGTINCGDTLGTLPAGFRPPVGMAFPGASNLFASRLYYRIFITTGGVITVDDPTQPISSPISSTDIALNLSFDI